MGEAAVPSLSVRNFSGLTLGNKSLQTQQLTCPELGTTLHWYRSLPPTKLDLLEHSLELQMHPNLPKSPERPGTRLCCSGHGWAQPSCREAPDLHAESKYPKREGPCGVLTAALRWSPPTCIM